MRMNRVKENADLHVYYNLSAKSNAKINVIITDNNIHNLKERLSKGNYILTESLTFGFENNTLKFY